ncbi:hypothetical protein AB833_14720 [Chromatiales bacterium (ex Bugula neritina AB1)]|nr:hypothetical protein AB833_14720 [Chromatiales bacterium (ex Bugula neritina AB1)]
MKPTFIKKTFSNRIVKTGCIVMAALAGVACGGSGSTITGISPEVINAPLENDAVTPPVVATVTGDTAIAADAPVVTPESVVAPEPISADPSAVAARPLTAESQALIADALARGSIRVMQAGDSITHGTRDSDSYRKAFASLMADAGCPITEVGSQSGTLHQSGFYAAHEGYSGHTADYFLEGRTTVSGENLGISHAVNFQKPDVVLLHLGSVDIFLGETVASTLAEVDQVIATIFDTKPDTMVFVANIIPWYDTSTDASIPQSIEALGTGIEQIVAESNNPLLALVDVRSGYSEGLMQADLIHPSASGDQHIADAFFDRIAPACE